jgi:hypothetical protein
MIHATKTKASSVCFVSDVQAWRRTQDVDEGLHNGKGRLEIVAEP